MDDKFSVNLLCRGQSLTWAGSRLCLKYSIFLCQSVAVQLKTNLGFDFPVQQFFFSGRLPRKDNLQLPKVILWDWQIHSTHTGHKKNKKTPCSSVNYHLQLHSASLCPQKSPSLPIRITKKAHFGHNASPFPVPPHICLLLISLTLPFCILHSYVFLSSVSGLLSASGPPCLSTLPPLSPSSFHHSWLSRSAFCHRPPAPPNWHTMTFPSLSPTYTVDPNFFILLTSLLTDLISSMCWGNSNLTSKEQLQSKYAEAFSIWKTQELEPVGLSVRCKLMKLCAGSVMGQQ